MLDLVHKCLRIVGLLMASDCPYCNEHHLEEQWPTATHSQTRHMIQPQIDQLALFDPNDYVFKDRRNK